MDIEKILALVGLGKQIKAAYDKADDAVIRELLASLQEVATDAKLEAISAKEEAVKLREKILVLEKTLGKKAELTQREDGLYYSPAGGAAVCPRCYEKNGNSMTLHKKEKEFGGMVGGGQSVSFGGAAWLECPECKNKYSKKHVD